MSQNLHPLQYLTRRILAKTVDLGFFAYVAVLIGTWLFREQPGAWSVVQAFASALWAAGVFVAADALCTVILGVTPGEMLTGIRVRRAAGGPLNWSQRQDRTVDGFVEGTFRCPRLLRCFSRGEPAPYDEEFHVEMRPLRLQHSLTSALGLLLVVVAFLAAVAGLGRLDTTTRVGGWFQQLLAPAGITVGNGWTNPITGLFVFLPPGCSLMSVVHRPFTGEHDFSFQCSDGSSSYAVRLVLNRYFPSTFADDELSYDYLETAIEGDLGESLGEMGITPFDSLSGRDQFDRVYTADLDRAGSGDHLKGTAFLWFTENQYEWAMSLTRPNDDESLGERSLELALQLMRSTRLTP